MNVESNTADMKKFLLMVAGGKGSRMGNALPKQFMEINNRPVLMHTADVFLHYDANIEIVLVLPQTEIAVWEKLCVRHKFATPIRLVPGGENRFLSVRNGLELVDSNSIVFIHDGVRPLVNELTIRHCYTGACTRGNAIPVVPVSESVRLVHDKGSHTVKRDGLVLVQTPQTFQAHLIKKAYAQAESTHFTDDASVLEATGESINLVPGNRENLKITYPEDVKMAEIFLAAR